jgi:hypothetical protein
VVSGHALAPRLLEATSCSSRFGGGARGGTSGCPRRGGVGDGRVAERRLGSAQREADDDRVAMGNRGSKYLRIRTSGSGRRHSAGGRGHCSGMPRPR